MRVGASPYVPMVRRPVVAAGGGATTAPAPVATPAPAPVAAQSASAPAQGTFDIKAAGMKVQSFLTNLWDTVIGPFIKSLFGMFGG